MNGTWKTVLKCASLFIGLLLLWPNLIHEPLHLAALQLQGSEGYISFNWSVPAHPSTTRVGEVKGLAGGFFFLLLPSVVSVIAFVALWKVNGWWWTTLSTYLGLDLLINVWKFQLPFSDWRFLTVVDGGWWLSAIMAGIIMVCVAGKISKEVMYGSMEMHSLSKEAEV